MRFSFLFNEVLTGLRRNITMTVAMILTTAISIGLFGGGLLVVRLADHSRSIYLDRVETQVFLTNDISADDATCESAPCKALREKLEKRDDVKSVRFLNRQDAYNDAIRKIPQFKDLASKDAFPASFVVKLENPEQHAEFDAAMQGQPGVDHVLNQKELIDRLFAVLDGLSNAAFAVALVQAVGAILLIANMVQVAAYTRRTEIGIMRLVGATRWYTQLPFLVEAIVAATAGVIIAIVGLHRGASAVPGQRVAPVLSSSPDRQGRLRRHPLHRAAAAIGRRRDGRGHVVRNVAPIRAAVAVAKKPPNKSAPGRQILATNRKARHNYSILDVFEAGVVLLGTEVKSLRDGKASLADAYATVDDGEVWLRNLHIPEYHHGSWTNHEPRRNRKLLLHRHQIDVLIGKIKDGNLALVPLSLYFFEGKVKVELALARGKQAHDKRQDMAKRDAQREVIRELGRRSKGMS